MKARRLAILCTHPIQYHSGWFKALAAQPKIDLEVLFCRTATSAEQAAAGFAVEFDWDVALLDGYQYRFLKNIARNPSVARFSGLDTPELLSVIERETFDAVIIMRHLMQSLLSAGIIKAHGKLCGLAGKRKHR